MSVFRSVLEATNATSSVRFRKGNNLKYFKDVGLKVKTSIWA